MNNKDKLMLGLFAAKLFEASAKIPSTGSHNSYIPKQQVSKSLTKKQVKARAAAKKAKQSRKK
jgi:hypothetical protein